MGRDQFQVIGVNIDEDPSDGVRFACEIPVSYPLVSDMQTEVLTAYEVKSVPTGFCSTARDELLLATEAFARRTNHVCAIRLLLPSTKPNRLLSLTLNPEHILEIAAEERIERGFR